MFIPITIRSINISAGHPFSRCDCLNAFIRWSLLSENESFVVVGTADALSTETLKHYAGSWAQYGNPCAWVSLNASAAGQATLVATFSFDSESYSEIFSGPIFLKSTSKISAYYPLVVLQAGSGNRFGGYWVDLSRIHSGIQNMVNNSPKELYLVPGSTMDVFLSGGPEQWDQLVDFVETVDVIGESKNYVVSSTAVQKLSSRLYRVSCPSKGNFVSTLNATLHFDQSSPFLSIVMFTYVYNYAVQYVLNSSLLLPYICSICCTSVETAVLTWKHDWKRSSCACCKPIRVGSCL